ncbi:hypothetical protein LHFGNBLO_004293 [Mesorhizobium sp. AR10]|uniref:hypothetical protein n=1 Tax=Mesorhizobium sp. AR10 TaxID=2865839 RepID=UPI00215FA1C8|nr:hypothetical protein [Mesorhizobium sp. AR10]UVK37282.1 hypothetical protein LHFGNBLO_004293 [Mesorhizobium sp. AR10]
MANKYWFARNRRGNGYSKGVMPISWEGRAVIAGFVVAMVTGGLIMLFLGLNTNLMALGIVIYVILAICGGGTFLWAAATKVDPDKTRADYQAERLRARSSGSRQV